MTRGIRDAHARQAVDLQAARIDHCELVDAHLAGADLVVVRDRGGSDIGARGRRSETSGPGYSSCGPHAASAWARPSSRHWRTEAARESTSACSFSAPRSICSGSSRAGPESLSFASAHRPDNSGHEGEAVGRAVHALPEYIGSEKWMGWVSGTARSGQLFQNR